MKRFKVKKKVIAKLEKCYFIAPLIYHGEEHFLAAAEKHDPCLLFDRYGKLQETIWDEPGGVMTMVQVPGSDGQFLATHKFYSPNDSKEAKIVVVTPQGGGKWDVQTLVNVPHVHRFDILERDGKKFLLVCSLKSGHEYKDDWSSPGKVYCARLPDNLAGYNERRQLKLEMLKDGMMKNHGYYRDMTAGVQTALISCEQGVFRFVPPALRERKWTIDLLLERPVSDAVRVDVDGDGSKELCTLAPFHGDKITIYKESGRHYMPVYTYPEDTEFAHACYGGKLCGIPALIAGHRRGKRNLIAIFYEEAKRSYQSQVLDEDCGPANIYHYVNEGQDIIISANREINEVAMYTIEKCE